MTRETHHKRLHHKPPFLKRGHPRPFSPFLLACLLRRPPAYSLRYVVGFQVCVFLCVYVSRRVVGACVVQRVPRGRRSRTWRRYWGETFGRDGAPLGAASFGSALFFFLQFDYSDPIEELWYVSWVVWWDLCWKCGTDPENRLFLSWFDERAPTPKTGFSFVPSGRRGLKPTHKGGDPKTGLFVPLGRRGKNRPACSLGRRG